MARKPTYEELEQRVRELERAESGRWLIEQEQLMTLEILQLINETESLDELLGSILDRLQHWSGCEAVAIRLKEGPDFPYFVTSGFPDGFVRMEKYLCSYDENGEVERDTDGAPILECMCGNIILGRFDPSKNFFTVDGSFWSNCTTNLLATTTDDDRQARTRNRCNSSGYESVALIPLRSAGETFGLIQLNDHREGRFSPELIAMYRRVADYIAGFLAKRQAREALQKSETHLRSLINTLPDMVWMKDPDGVYVACNNRFERFFGAGESEIIGRTDYDFVDKNQADWFREKDKAAMATGKPCVNEEEVTFADDGHRELLETIKAPIYDTDGKITGVLGISRDITRRKQAEEDREKMHEQLIQAQKMESVGRLAGGVAHDLNNLLSPVLGYAEMLLEDLGFNDDRREWVNEILRAGTRARDLVRQLLAFSRKQTLEFKALDVNATIDSFTNLLRRTIPEDIEIQIISSPDIRPVMADVGQIEQVIMNLAVNAADAMPDGGVLTIETAAVELDEAYAGTHPDVQPGPHVMLAISDKGLGMDEETRKRIFEPFFSTKGERGTGLGLATVYGIVKQHGGNIWVYSEPGRGTTFKIYLPVSDKAQNQEKTGKKKATDLKGGEETILLVEDDELVRQLAGMILKRQGYRILEAINSVEALNILESHNAPVHLLLTDVVMPGLNGRELYEKATQKQPALKALYMSGYTDNIIAHRGVLEEGVHFIQKPFSNQTLTAKVREVLDEE